MTDPKATGPLVSIIIPSFNHRQYVEQSIRSALNQSYGLCEVVVVDDASVDGSGELLEKLAGELNFRLIRNPRNLGLNANLEIGLAQTNGAYVSVLGSDDWIVPEKITEQLDIISRENLDAIYGTGWTYEDGTCRLIDLADLEELFVKGTVLQQFYVDCSHAPLLQSALIRRECFDALVDERRRFKSDDWVMLIRLVERYRVGFVNTPWFYYRQHSANSYRNYWQTLPQRVEVIAEVVPEQLRHVAMSNLFRDQAQFLFMDGKRRTALKFLAASMMLRPSARVWAPLLISLSWRLIRRVMRRERAVRVCDH